jgi:thiol-disulfide isomerase/thioredoxin
MQLPSNQNKSPRLRNFAIAVVAMLLAVSLYIGIREQNSTTSLSAQASQSVALDVALTNGKPTSIEFYADWCGVCQSMAGDLAEIKKEYGDKVNFAMLNVDNTKWLPEVDKYKVDGIPHFVFLDAKGKTVAEKIGEQPLSVLHSNLQDLIAGKQISDTSIRGDVSAFSAAGTDDRSTDPRAHGS